MNKQKYADLMITTITLQFLDSDMDLYTHAWLRGNFKTQPVVNKQFCPVPEPDGPPVNWRMGFEVSPYVMKTNILNYK